MRDAATPGPAHGGAPPAPPSQPRRWPALLRSWSFADYRRLWICVAAANSGRWVLALGVGWLLYSLTHSSFWVGAGFFGIQAPALLVAPLAGVWADRHDRRRLLVAALALAALGTGTLTVLTVLGAADIGVVLACTLLCGVAFSAQGTAWGALVPGTIPRADLSNAVALQGTARQGAEFLGPLLASPLLAAFGPAAVFACACTCYLLATGLALRLAPRALARPARARHAFAPLLDGLRYVRATPALAGIILLVAGHCSLTMTYQGLLPQFATSALGGGSDAYGALMTMVGLGAIAGTLGLAAVSDRRGQGTLYVVTAVASGAALLLLGSSHRFGVALVFALATGAAQATFMAISLTFLQALAADAFLGRVTGVYNFLASGTMAAASWGFGGLAGAVAPSAIMVAAGGAFMLVTTAAVFRFPSVRRLCLGVAPAP